MRRSLVLLVAFLLVAGALPAAEDYIQLARERMEMRAYEDALKFINLELTTHPESWRGYFLRGEYHLRGYSRHKEALNDYRKSWHLTLSQTVATDRESYLNLGEQITKLVQERVTQAGAGGVKVLEQAVLKENIYTMPLILGLFQQYNLTSNWAGILQAAEIIRKVPASAILYSNGPSDIGTIAFYCGRAQLRLGNLKDAFTQMVLAKEAGVSEAGAALPDLRLKIEEAALPLLQNAKAVYDANPPNYIQAGLLYQNILSKVPLGTNAYKEATAGKANCETAVAIDVALKAVEQARQKGDLKSAEELLNKALEKYPSDPRLRSRQAELERMQDRIKTQLSKVEEDKNNAEKEAKTTRGKLIAEGQENVVKKHFMEAIQAFQKAQDIEATKEVADLLKDAKHDFDLAQRYEGAQSKFKSRNYTGALKDYESLQEDDPNFQKVAIRKAIILCYFEMGRNEPVSADGEGPNSHKARSLAEGYLDHHEDPELLLKMADYHESKKDSRVDLKKALGYLERLQKVGPDPALDARVTTLSWELNKMTYIGLGFVVLVWLLAYLLVRKKPELAKKVNFTDLERYMNKKDYRSAADLHQQIITAALSEKEELQARTLFARAFFETREHSKCINECQVILRLLPENKQIKVLMARSLYATKTIAPDTLPFYLELIETDPQNRELINYVGTFIIKKRLINNVTLPLLRTLANINPDDDKLRDLLIKGYLKDNDRTVNALTLFEIEIRKNPKNLEVRAVMAEEYLRKGDVTKAIQECEEIINIDLHQARTHKVLAAAYAKLGKTDQLIAIYQGILDNDPHNGTIQAYLGKVIAGLGQSGAQDRSGVLGRSAAMERTAERSAAADRSGLAPRGAVLEPAEPAEGSAALDRTATRPASPGPFSGDLPLDEEAPPQSPEKSGVAGRSAALGRSAVAKRVATKPERPQLFDPSGGMEDERPQSPPPKSAGVSCPKCGNAVPFGTYFCSCGQML